MNTKWPKQFWGSVRRGMQAIVCLMFLVGANSAFAQMDQGAITGTVTDSTGAVVPSAQVTLTSTDTSLVLHGQTDGSGVYVFSPIKIGKYRLTADAL